MKATPNLFKKMRDACNPVIAMLVMFIVFVASCLCFDLFLLGACAFAPNIATAFDYGFFAGFMPLSQARLLTTVELFAVVAYNGFVLAFILPILALALSVFRRIARDYTPFGPQHAHRFRIMGALMMALSVGHTVVASLLSGSLLPEGYSTAPFALLGIAMIVFGAMFLSLAYIFEYGSVLQVESDETL